jgi:hypothetical protein
MQLEKLLEPSLVRLFRRSELQRKPYLIRHFNDFTPQKNCGIVSGENDFKADEFL